MAINTKVKHPAVPTRRGRDELSLLTPCSAEALRPGERDGESEPCATLRSSALSGSARAEIRYDLPVPTEAGYAKAGARAKPRTPFLPSVVIGGEEG